MSRHKKTHHYLFPQIHSSMTRRKVRLLRIRHNKRMRKLGLSSKRFAPTVQSLYRDEPFIGRDGWPISARAYLRHREDANYSTVACDWYKSVMVSTVWLGKLWPDGFSNFLFETMVFVNGKDEHQRRYRTEAEARRGHAQMLEQVKRDVGSKPRAHRRSDFIIIDDVIHEESNAS